MNETVSILLGAGIVSVVGTVNGVEVVFTEISPQVWQAEAERAIDGKYVLDITATDSNGLDYHYNVTRYYFQGWTPPIYNRAQIDIDNGTDKAYLNYHDLNRIESNCVYLVDLLQQYGYSIAIETNTTWDTEKIPYIEELDRVRLNIGTISDSFHKLPTTPALPESMDNLNYGVINDLEKILFDTNFLFENMIKSFRYCGTFNAGSEDYAIGYS